MTASEQAIVLVALIVGGLVVLGWAEMKEGR